MKITASLVAKGEWSASCTRDLEEDNEGYFSNLNDDLTIASVIAELLCMSGYQIVNLEYVVACIVFNVLMPGRQEYDEETHAFSHRLYLVAKELRNHIEACHEARQQKYQEPPGSG